MEIYRRMGLAERTRTAGYPAVNPMDVFVVERLCDMRGAELGSHYAASPITAAEPGTSDEQ